MMKRIIFIVFAILFITSNVYAEQIQLTCNSNNEFDLAGYRIYQSNLSNTYNKQTQKVSEVMIGPNQQPFFDIDIQPEDGRTVYFVATAFDTSGNESGFSNEVAYVVNDDAAPNPPTMLGVIQQIASALTNISENGLRVVVIKE